jgi:hypothetical protein
MLLAIAFAHPSPSNDETVVGDIIAEENANPTDLKEVDPMTRILRLLTRMVLRG